MCCLPHTMLHIQASMSHCLQSIACGCRNYVLPEDLEYFLPAHKAAKAFDLLDVDSDGRVTLHDIRDAVLNVYSVGPIAMPQQYRLSLPFYVAFTAGVSFDVDRKYARGV